MDTIRQFEGAMADGGPGAVARALVEACVNEVMSAPGVSTRKVGKVLEKMGPRAYPRAA